MKKLLLLFVVVCSTLTFATTYTVTNTDDSGPGSLRQAILDASTGDTVDFDLMLLAYGNDTIKLTSEISIFQGIVIEGYYTSNDTLFVSGEGSSRIFNISTSSNISISGMTFINGSAIDGGAIYKNGSGLFTLDNCNFMNNTSTDQGGAIYKGSGNMLVTNCQFFNNDCVLQGGAIYLSPSGQNDIEYSTFQGNYSADDGGGIYGFVAPLNVDQCTFTENEAVSEGGAIYDWGSAVIMNVTNTTIVGNIAASSAGIDCWGSSIVVTIQSSVIVGNTGTTNLDIWGAGAMAVSNGYNVFGDASYAGALGSDQLGVAIGVVDLAVLGDYGGLTYTMMPSAASVATDNGTPADMIDAQNGIISDGTRDAGAAEYYSCPDRYASFYVSDCSTYTVPSGDETYSLGGTSVVYDTIPTACGADSILTIIVIIDDIVAPVPDVAALPDVDDACEVTLSVPSATDACEGSITGTTTTTFPITTPGLTVVTWTYDDGNGNISTQDQNVNITGIDLTVTLDGVTLTAAATGATYQWVDCNDSYAAISGATDSSFTPAQDGSYAVIITDGSCSDTSACTDVSGVGISELSNSVSIYPNPANGVVNVELHENAFVSIIAMDGKVIVPETLVSVSKIAFDLSAAERGVYLVRIRSDKGEWSQRLILQ